MKTQIYCLMLLFVTAAAMAADEKVNCTSDTKERMLVLPAPLNNIARIECGLFGQSIVANEQWTWVQGMPYTYGLPGSIPAIGTARLSAVLMQEDEPELAYFTQISVSSLPITVLKQQSMAELASLVDADINQITKLFQITTINQLGDKNTLIAVEYITGHYRFFDANERVDVIMPKFSAFKRPQRH
ncbi:MULTISPECIES: hypothetical protein [unclassified Motilimonas]|uniref:hypothetical protein n=1 Tax=unclassified Motilimonas TaxID=2643697 RepID=UPI001E2E34B4|nr:MULTISPECIES: hypothetical protein [unclassified Motilimonas]MCE0558288.1 hypothetical protein [Motilimonas sp. E26]MDO6524652.1 hypothetical protein [Motilimonas sp. 1_MG-2023]